MNDVVREEITFGLNVLVAVLSMFPITLSAVGLAPVPTKVEVPCTVREEEATCEVVPMRREL